MSTQQKALWLPEPGGVFKVGTKDVAKPGPGELLVKVEAAALNPVGQIGALRHSNLTHTACAGRLEGSDVQIRGHDTTSGTHVRCYL
jgi:hypothetical protein